MLICTLHDWSLFKVQENAKISHTGPNVEEAKENKEKLKLTKSMAPGPWSNSKVN